MSTEVDWIVLLIISPLVVLCVVGFLSLFGEIVFGILDDFVQMVRRGDWGPLKRFAGFCAFLALIAGLCKALSYLPANPIAIGVISVIGVWMLVGLGIGCVGLWKELRK